MRDVERGKVALTRVLALLLVLMGNTLSPSLLSAQQFLPYRPVELPSSFVPSIGSGMLNDQDQIAGYILVNRQMVPAMYDLETRSIVQLGKNQGVVYATENNVAVGRIFDGRTNTMRAAAVMEDGSTTFFSMPRVNKMSLSIATASSDNGMTIGFLSAQGKLYGFACPSLREPCTLISSVGSVSGARDAGAKPEAVNNLHQVVGNSNLPFIWTQKSGSKSLPMDKGFSNLTVSSLNNVGGIVGFAREDISGKLKLVVWNKDLKPSVPKAQKDDTDYLATDNNDRGYIVGQATDKSRVTSAFVYDREKISDLTSLTDGNPKLTRAHAINNWGSILASAPSATGMRPDKYYLLIPAEK